MTAALLDVWLAPNFDLNGVVVELEHEERLLATCVAAKTGGVVDMYRLAEICALAGAVCDDLYVLMLHHILINVHMYDDFYPSMQQC